MNKTLKKALALALCAVFLVVGSVAGTMAYLTSKSATVTNTFTLGKVAITLDESKVDAYGVVDTGADRVTTNAYKLIPGHEYIKDPIIHVGSDSENAWLFVKVVNGISDIEATGDSTIAEQMERIGWTPVGLAGAENVYAYKDVVKANDQISVFNRFVIAGTADLSGSDSKSIAITA